MKPKYEILVVLKCPVGEGDGWLVAGIPRDEPDVSIFQGVGTAPPGDWTNHGIFYDREQALDQVRLLDYLMAAAASFENSQRKP